MSKLFDGKLVFTQIPLLLKYLPVTMELAVTAMIASLILGLLLALVKIKKIPVLKQLVSIYISVIRGTPILVQLYVTYFGIPMLLKYINFKPTTMSMESHQSYMHSLLWHSMNLHLTQRSSVLPLNQ